MEGLSLRKGWAENVSAMLKGGGGGTTSFGVVFTQYLDVLAILKGGGARSLLSLKGGPRKVLPCLEGGGGTKSFGPAIFPFCSPPSL